MVPPPRRILIVEDDPVVREALGGALRDAGLAVDAAIDGRDGLDQLRSGAPPSLVLLDLRMPTLGGEEFLRAMREDEAYEHVPVITMSAGPDPAGSAEVVAHLHKPFDLHGLLQVVLAVVGATAV